MARGISTKKVNNLIGYVLLPAVVGGMLVGFGTALPAAKEALSTSTILLGGLLLVVAVFQSLKYESVLDRLADHICG